MFKITFLRKLEKRFKTNKEFVTFYEKYVFVPGICSIQTCDYVDHVAIKTQKGYCPACQKNTVKSFHFLKRIVHHG